MLQSIELAVTQAENHVRRITSTGVAKVAELGDTHLPKDVERSKRVFNADAMFAQRRTAGPADGKRAQLARRRSSNFGTVGLDLGLTSRQDLLQVTIADIIDFQHLFVEPKLIKSIKGGDEEHEAAVSPWGMASVAAGAVTVFGGQALGMRTLLRNAAQIWDFLGDASSRRMIAPVTGAVLLGLTLYVVHDLPSSIPRNVGRHLHLALLSDNSGLPAGSIGSGTYPEHQTIRMQREARKVIRLASWDLRERFKAALEARGRAVEECEGVEKRADKAVEWFREVEDRVTLIREQMKLL
jgi:mitofusin